MSLRTNRQVILAKIESVYGTDPTPTGGANAILCKNVDFQPLNAELVQRDLIRPYLGNSDTLLASRDGVCSFEVEFAGSGAAGTAPAFAALLKACGFAEVVDPSVSVTYAPVSQSFSSLTLYGYRDGVLHKLKGCRGTFEISLEVKQIPTFKFTFTGLYAAPSDASVPTSDFSDFVIPKVANSANSPTFSIFGYNAIAKSLSLNLGGEVNHLEYIGSESVEFVNRKPGGSVLIQAPLMATKDFFTLANNGTTGALSLVHGTVAGNIVTLAAPRVSIGNPQYQDDNGIQLLSIPLTVSPDSGDDDFTIAFT